MLILDSTNESLRVRLSSAHTTTALRCVTSWRTTTTTEFTPGTTLASTNGTTGVEIASAPAASSQRVIDFASILNTDTITHTVTVYIFDGTTNFDIISVVLGPAERIEYGEGYGFQTYNAAGSLKTLVTATQNVKAVGWSTVVLGSDVANSNPTLNTLADITGLSFPVVNGTRYWFEFFIFWTSAASTTGARFTINGPAQDELAYRSDYSLTGSTRTVNELASTYQGPGSANATPANVAGNIATIDGFVRPTVDGTLIAQFASEVANSAITAKAGSMVRYIAVT